MDESAAPTARKKAVKEDEAKVREETGAANDKNKDVKGINGANKNLQRLKIRMLKDLLNLKMWFRLEPKEEKEGN